MARALTTKAVDNLKPDPARRLEIPDPGLTGLYLVVQPSGSKSWALRYRFAGKPVKLTLGRWPVMGVADARSAASKALERIDRGENPADDKKAAKAAAEPGRDKLRSVIEVFLARHASRNRRPEAVSAMFQREVLDKWGEREIQTITKRDMIELLDAVVDRGSPVTANRLRAHLNTLFNWAKGRDILQVNPLDGVKPPAPEKPRDRVLSDNELRLFWAACEGLGHPFGPLYRFLLLTGQRLREAAEMTWPELNGTTWILPAGRAKNGSEHLIPLSPAAIAILEAQPRIGRYLFSTTGSTPVSGFTHAKQRLDRLMAEAANKDLPKGAEPLHIPPFTIHDLRRTAATGMAGLRVPPHVVEAVLNHRSGTRRGVAAVYNRFDYAEEKRAALEAWAGAVFELVGVRPIGGPS